MTWVLVLACVIATIPAGLRWLRVAQREHYLFPSVTRFSIRWWLDGTLNMTLIAGAVVGVVGAFWSTWPGFLTVLAQVGPVGLRVRGTTSPLSWTPRLLRLAALSGPPIAVVYLVAGIYELAWLAALGLMALPLMIDLALLALAPIERSLGDKWVSMAASKLANVSPRVVAITGSYGKTTTKGYVAHLVAGSRRVVATPASFNNRLGLARAINENLVVGTEVFVAEMGTYGPGEIADMCSWVRPDVAAIVALGPVHLERFRTEERILEAKAEILDRARVGVICVDHPLLAELAARRGALMPIVEVSTGERGRVCVVNGHLVVDGSNVADVPQDVFAANLAVAAGVCLALDMEPSEWADRVDSLPRPQHRQTMSVGESGVGIVDDTFNSNPAGARRALQLLAGAGSGSKVVVTPGMVELGPLQQDENERLGREAATVADHLLVVGTTNRAALLRGSSGGRAAVTVVDSRDEAVAWVRANLGPGDTVLYENDLPDHYP